MLVHVALGEVADDLGDLVDVTGRQLLDVQLVPTGPVHLLLDDGRTQDLEDLGDLIGVDDVTHSDLLRVLDGNIDDQTVGRQHGELQVFPLHALDHPFGNGLDPCRSMTRIDDHIADLVPHESSVKTIYLTLHIMPYNRDDGNTPDTTRQNLAIVPRRYYPLCYGYLHEHQ